LNFLGSRKYNLFVKLSSKLGGRTFLSALFKNHPLELTVIVNAKAINPSTSHYKIEIGGECI